MTVTEMLLLLCGLIAFFPSFPHSEPAVGETVQKRGRTPNRPTFGQHLHWFIGVGQEQICWEAKKSQLNGRFSPDFFVFAFRTATVCARTETVGHGNGGRISLIRVWFAVPEYV